MNNSICLVMMVKNEATTLKRAVESCRPFVDGVLISVDSNSEDGTLEIAKEIADFVLQHDFETEDTPHGSFAKCRNHIIQGALENSFGWAIQLDGHEYICPKGKDTFKSLIEENPKCDAFSFGLNMNGTIVRQVRMHRTLETIRYNGDIHNVLSGYKNEKYNTTIEFFHDRADQPGEYIKQRDIQRKEMSLKILGEKIEKNPKDARAMFYLAQSLKETGKIKKAIELFERYLTVSNFQAEKWNACKYMYDCWMSLNNKEKALAAIHRGLKEQERAEGYVILGNAEYDNKNYEIALELYKKASETKRPNFAVFISEDDYTWIPHDKMSMCYHNLKKYLEAIEEAALSIKNKPRERQLKRIADNIGFWVKYIREGST